MIISASRRTDIPAFYHQWFLNRIKQGYVLVRNPFNPRQVSRVSLDRRLIDCIVFWTKDPRPLMACLEELKDWIYYFLFTLTAYGPDLEPGLPPKKQLVQTFVELAERIGPGRVIWRYDPIVLTDVLDDGYHCRVFEEIAGQLQNHTNRCIISFLDMYKKCRRNLGGVAVKTPNSEEMLNLAGRLQLIAEKYRIPLVTCAEDIDFTSVGISAGSCIDGRLIGQLTGDLLVSAMVKDKCQRPFCRCIESVDIGAYNTCNHLCRYCYANANPDVVRANIPGHNPASPLLLGELTGTEIITERSSNIK